MTEPLRLPPGQPPEPSWFERACLWEPIVGWIIANELGKKRTFPALEALADQLAKRPSTQSEWGTLDAECGQLAAFISMRVKEEFGWPSDHFIPDDPFDLMFFYDDGTGVEVYNAIEEYLELPQGSISNERFDQRLGLTFKEFVESLLSLSR